MQKIAIQEAMRIYCGGAARSCVVGKEQLPQTTSLTATTDLFTNGAVESTYHCNNESADNGGQNESKGNCTLKNINDESCLGQHRPPPPNTMKKKTATSNTFGDMIINFFICVTRAHDDA